MLLFTQAATLSLASSTKTLGKEETRMKKPTSKVTRNVRVSSSARRELLGKLNLDAQAITLAILAIVAIFSIAPELQIWYTQQVQIADLKRENEATRNSLIQMKDDLKRWDDPAYVRAQARNRLFYVMPGEISFLVMDADKVNASDSSGTVGDALARARNSSAVTKKISTTKSNWTTNLVETVVRAGIEQPKA
jgi:cell division protein FtsB